MQQSNTPVCGNREWSQSWRFAVVPFSLDRVLLWKYCTSISFRCISDIERHNGHIVVLLLLSRSNANAIIPRHVGAITPVEQSIYGIGIVHLLVAVVVVGIRIRMRMRIRMARSRMSVVVRIAVCPDRHRSLGHWKEQMPRCLGESLPLPMKSLSLPSPPRFDLLVASKHDRIRIRTLVRLRQSRERSFSQTGFCSRASMPSDISTGDLATRVVSALLLLSLPLSFADAWGTISGFGRLVESVPTATGVVD